MRTVSISPHCVEVYPWMRFGYCFVDDLEPKADVAPLRARQQEVERHVRAKVETLSATAKAISRFYKQQGEKNRSHIESLIKSISNGKAIKPVNYIVDSVMVAEMRHAMLLGVHDMDRVQGDIILDAAEGETFTGIGERLVRTRPHEVVLRDDLGIWASYTQGPDTRTIIGPATRNVMFLGFFTPETAVEPMAAALREAVDGLLEVAEGRPGDIVIIP